MKTHQDLVKTNRLREQARQILRDRTFDKTLIEFRRGDFTLDSLLEELHIYHAELLIQQEALRDSQEVNELALACFVRLYYDLPLPALLVSREGLITESNAAAAAVLPLNRQLFVLLAESHHVSVLDSAFRQACATGKSHCPEVALHGAGGATLIADLMLIRLPEAAASEPEFVCTIIDQTERIARETRYRQRETEIQRLALVVEQSPSIVLITDTQGVVEYVNERFCAVTGYRREEVCGRNMDLIKSDATPITLYAEMWRTILSGQTWRGEFQNRRQSGELYWEQALITPLRNEQGVISHFVKLAEDISEKKALSERLAYLSHYEPLTGLPNRTLMREQISHALIQARLASHGLAVLSIDLDNLKFINDSLGHAAGDRLLREVARRLQTLLGEDDKLGSLGGDKFVLLAGRLRRAQDSVALVERIQTALDSPIVFGDNRAIISACIGIALYPEDAQTTDDLIGHADSALHIAKTEGRRLYRFYTPTLNREILEQFQLEQALRQAFECDELLLHYQPRVEIETGRILSLEALVRWNHPDWGLVSPARFIPIAEATGLILQLGPLVLRLVCRQIRQWRAAGVPTVPVAVNLSAGELYQDGLAQQIGDCVAGFQITPADLEFEITESAAMRSIDQAIAILSTLRGKGFVLSVDDFGTGYASLSYLNRLPMQAIKIDQSFLAEIGGEDQPHRQSAAIVKAIIGLGSTLGLHIIAEGVETQAQRRFLLEHGCQVAQGYLFARPMPADQIEPLLRDGYLPIDGADASG